MFFLQLGEILRDASRRAASIMGITRLKRVLDDVYLGLLKRAAWFSWSNENTCLDLI